MKYTYIFFLFIGVFMTSKSHAALEKMDAVTFADKLAVVPSTQVQETQQLMEHLLEKQQAFEMRMYIITGCIVVLVLIFMVLCFHTTKGDKRLLKIIQLLETQKTASNDKKQHDDCLDIDPEIVTTILQELEAFEKERGFLTAKISLHAFAKNIQTNTKYLSKVINTYKLKSFRNYINDLRIQYSIEQLQNNNRFRNYTVKAMAEEAGFTTVNSFSKAFQKRTGNTVSGFLKQEE